jgi:UDP-glucose 4-epimerase
LENKFRIAVTGGLGFVGSATALRLLAEGHEVLVVDDGRDSVARGAFRPSEVFLSKIESPETAAAIARFRPAVVCHFAATADVEQCAADPLRAAENNVGAWATFLKTAIMQAIPVVHSGTCAVYGRPETLPVGETDPERPESWYGWTKLFAEKVLRASGLPAVFFRYFNVAGSVAGIVEKRRSETHLVPNLLARAADGLPFRLNGRDFPTPDGTPVRDFVHVEDVARAHAEAAVRLAARGHADPLSGEIVNLGSGRGCSVFEVLYKVEKITGKTLLVARAPRREGDIPEIWADCQKAEKLLGWKAKNSLADCIRDACEARGLPNSTTPRVPNAAD